MKWAFLNISGDPEHRYAYCLSHTGPIFPALEFSFHVFLHSFLSVSKRDGWSMGKKRLVLDLIEGCRAGSVVDSA